jgi:hypothetical protein
MGGKHSAIGNLKYHEGSDSEIFSSVKRHQEPTEDTPIHLMNDEMRNSYYAFQMFCTNWFGMLMCFLLMLSIICSIISATLYILYDFAIWNNPNILCINGRRMFGMIIGIIFTCLLIVSFASWMTKLGYGRSRSRRSFANQMCLLSAGCIIGPILFIGGYSIVGTPMLIKSPNNIIYDCEFDEGDMDAHLILAWPDQNCEFRPIYNV